MKPVRCLLLIILGVRLAAAPPAASLELGNGHTLAPRSAFTDQLGQTHTRFDHYYQGLRVWGSDTISHSGPGLEQGRPALPRLLARSPGAGNEVQVAPLPVDLTLTVPLDQALQAIRTRLGTDGASAKLTQLETVIYPDAESYPTVPGASNAAQVIQLCHGYSPAYRIQAETAAGPWEYLVDAHSGAVLQRIRLEHAAVPAKGTGNTLYSGRVSLDTVANQDGFQLLDTTRSQSGPYRGNAIVELNRSFFDPETLCSLGPGSDNIWGDGRPEGLLGIGAAPLTVAADAAYGLQNAWDYFLRIHNWNGWDGLGTGTFVKIHGLASDNASWSSLNKGITIASAHSYWPWASPRTLAHEFAHGVTDSTADLIYLGESGALNEASSDIFAAMAQVWRSNGAGASIGDGNSQWTIEARPQDGGPAKVLRDMIQPSSVRDDPSPDAWSSSLVFLDVHKGSGPMNRAFYFMCQGASADPKAPNYSGLLPQGMTGIGNDKAARIWFRTLTTRLGKNSDYKAARAAALRTAVELYGTGSAENIAVHKAFEAIGVGTPGAPLDDFEAPTVTVKAELAGGTLRLLADARDNDRVASVTWLVDDQVVGTRSTEPFTLVLDSGRVLANGSHLLSAQALDPSGNVGTAPVYLFSLANPSQQLLADPGLEQDSELSPWGSGRSRVRPAGGIEPGISPHGDSRYAVFGAGYQELRQIVSLPAGADEASLRLWAWISTDAPDRADRGPTIGVYSIPAETDGSPKLLATLARFTGRDAWEDWVPYRFDLSAFIGQRVELRLQQITPTPGSSFRIDDITLLCGARPVDVIPTPALLDLLPGESSPALGATVLGSANQTVTWSVAEAGGGTLDGLRYTAPATTGVYHLLATPQANPAAAARVSIQVRSPFQVQPAAPVLEAGAVMTLTLIIPEGMKASADLQEGSAAGSMTRFGALVIYRAPAVPGTYHLLVRNSADLSGNAGQLVVALRVVAPVAFAIEPATQVLAVGSSCQIVATADGQFTVQATYAVQEGPEGGSLSPDPASIDLNLQNFQAPAKPGVYHVIATSSLNPAKQATCTITVEAGMVINPPRWTMITGRKKYFTAILPGQPEFPPAQVAWSASAGSISPTGLFTAPSAAGTCTITARTTDGSDLSYTATVIVKSTDLDGSGRSDRSFGDLAVVADAFGSADARADLDGNGVVDDEDVAQVMVAFEQPAAATPPSHSQLPPRNGRRFP